MTKKHFKAIADIIYIQHKEYISQYNKDNNYADGYGQSCQDIANELTDYFAKENPRFDRDKFLTACGL